MVRVGRLLILGNRLPITLRAEGGDVSVVRSAGGLATALRDLHERNEGLWIGWPGDVSTLSPELRTSLDARLEASRTIPVHLDPDEVSRYYEGYANGTLWPLFHYFLDKVALSTGGEWETYEAVNERFAEVAAAHYRPGDVIWVHDYQLMLVPEMLRRRLPDAKIGFFLHIPFPAAEVFRTLPARERLLRGLLGADVIGFHTSSYRYHFVQAAALLLGIDPEIDALSYDGRVVRLGVYPIGVDAAGLANLAASEPVREEARRIRQQAPGGRIVLCVDRLDYTKGVLRRLAAIERFLSREHDPEVRFVQLAVPTRERIDTYEQMRKEVMETVGTINSRYGSVDRLPIHFLYQSISPEDLVALYSAADVMLVTPLRDGMNLVAKEYVAVRSDDTGVLVLSELAGAAAELVEAVLVNPFDVESVADAIGRALSMDPAEQRVRMSALRRRVAEHDVHRWARSFLDDLTRSPAPEAPTRESLGGAPPLDLTERFRGALGLTLLLDYDGTLVPLSARPELAAPDAELIALLAALAARPGTRVHLASGRRREDLDRWFGSLPIELHAEHGFWSRAPGGEWTSAPLPPLDWMAEVRAILEDVTVRTPGSLIEEKSASFAWHYRTVDFELARERLAELSARLAEIVRARDLETMRGAKVLEVRVRGVNKSLAVARAMSRVPEDGAVIAIGDDRTDEDLFAALPPSALTIHVGRGTSRASFRLPDPAAVRRFLRSFLS